MEIVIKINEDAYNLLEQKYKNGKADVLDCIVLNGNVLPKGHGKLIDVGKVTDIMWTYMMNKDKDSKSQYVMSVAKAMVENATPIIEEDKE